MCNLFHMSPKGDVERALGQAAFDFVVEDYEPTFVAPFGNGLFVRPGPAPTEIIGQMGQWGMIKPGNTTRLDYIEVPGRKPKVKSTNNARLEDIRRRPTFTHAWQNGKRCLIPAVWYQEPNWETGKHIPWKLKRADGQPWFIAGLWWEWHDPNTGEIVPNFTMLTVNCTGHPLLGRLHRAELDKETRLPLPSEKQDKRSVVHIDQTDWVAWLHGDETEARKLLKPQPAHVFDQADALATDQALAGPGGLTASLL